jgi:lambda family phage portal protein
VLTLNAWDRLIGYFSPAAAIRNGVRRQVLAEYEGGKPSRLRKAIKDERPPNYLVTQSAAKLRNYARYQERNHDIARGILNVLVRNVVGPDGIAIEPMPMMRDGKVHQTFADQLMLLFKDWSRRPEVTWTFDWAGAQRQAGRSWLRDGDAFAQAVEGLSQRIDHGTRVPLSLELLEADLVPLDFEDLARNIKQGVECNDWGRPRAFHVYRDFPGEDSLFATFNDLKRVPAERMLHLARRDRLHQLRGVSIFASVVNRLEDLKDYEESERIAARIAAALTAVISRNPENDTNPQGTSEQGRPLLKLEAGTIFDGANAGDDITIVDSKRPNAGLEPFRNGQMRAVASGTSVSYSSGSKNYDGSYSAQRQELVEQWPEYRCLTAEFVSQFVMPVWERFVGLAILSNQIKIPVDVDPTTLTFAQFMGPPMPWIDPLKEAQANRLLVRSCFKSATQVVRERGSDPWNTFRQISDERAHWGELNLASETNPADDKSAAAPAADTDPEDPENPDEPARKPPKPDATRKHNGAGRHAS